ncbi:MAG: hypothetical protein IJM59_11170 [Proteobacteria bacterium]|nr:hypothetical protein [Pseudomonadota bacterium]
MNKRILLIGLLTIVGGSFSACQMAELRDYSECTYNVDCKRPPGMPQAGCFTVNGVSSCKDICHGSVAGDNAPVCSTPADSDGVSYSAIESCAADDNGKLYLVSTNEYACKDGCNKATGKCREFVDPNATCEDLHCESYAGGRPHVCVSVSGYKSCEPECFGKKTGKNAPVCYVNGSLPPEYQLPHSEVDTCALDDNGTLYSVSTKSDECKNGCDRSTGLCKNKDNTEVECKNDKECIIDDYVLDTGCFLINGKSVCKDACRSKSKGRSAPMCFDFWTDPEHMYTGIETCAADDNGKLYLIDLELDICPDECDGSTGLCKNNVDPEPGCHNDSDCIWPDYPYEQGCFTVNGKTDCQKVCRSKAEGKNAPMCYWIGGYDPYPEPMHLGVETCAKDDNGRLYLAKLDLEDCLDGCDETTNECKPSVDPDETCKALNCEAEVGSGRTSVCVSISGKKTCKYHCLNKNVGDNEPVCFVNGSLDPDVATQYSAFDTCALDDNGILYSVSTDMIECVSGCSEVDGWCKAEGPILCTKNCSMDGGDPMVCTIISGKEKCSTACFGKKVGENVPVCYQNASLGPNSPYYSVVDTCAKDDMGTLYSENAEMTKCTYGCDKSTGVCLLNNPQNCPNDCKMDGGYPMVCTTISGKKQCKTACFGNAEGVNAPVCFQNASVGPNGPVYSVIASCAKDDNGTLYSISANWDKCYDNKCNEDNGECEPAMPN